MIKIKPIIFGLLCYLIPFYIHAQKQPQPLASYGFACEQALYKLINNQLNLLSTKGDGRIQWKPILPPFERPLTVLSYCLEDNFMYSVDSLTHELIRIYKSGALQPLGIPVHALTKAPLEAELTVGELGEGLLCAYAPKQHLLYWIDIKNNTFVTSSVATKEKWTNVTYCSTRKLFCYLGNNSTLYLLNPKTKQMSTEVAFMQLPNALKEGGSNLWSLQKGRLFATRRKGRFFYELDAEQKMAYTYGTELKPSDGDVTSCPNGGLPAFIEADVLEFKLDPPKVDQVIVRWTAVREYTNAAYNIEHSVDQRVWSSVNWKPSYGANVYQNPYGALVPYKKNALNYYRLKKNHQYGGKTVYSHTLVLGKDKKQALKEVLISPKILLDNTALVLYFDNYKGEQLHISLSDIYGVLLLEKEQPIFSSELTLSLDIEPYKTGWYLLSIQNQKGVQQEWVWIQSPS